MIQKTKRAASGVVSDNSKSEKYLGIHLIAEFWNGKVIEDPKIIKDILTTAAKKAHNTPLEVIIHKFEPQGLTGVILLAESHIALHLWPEFNYIAIDIFTCGNKTSPQKALDYFKKEFQPQKIEIKEIKRGKIIII